MTEDSNNLNVVVRLTPQQLEGFDQLRVFTRGTRSRHIRECIQRAFSEYARETLEAWHQCHPLRDILSLEDISAQVIKEQDNG